MTTTNRNSEPAITPANPEDMQALTDATGAHVSNLAFGVYPTALAVIQACEQHTITRTKGGGRYHSVHGLDLVPDSSTQIHMANLNMTSNFRRVWRAPVQGALRPWGHRLSMVDIEVSGYLVEEGRRDSLETSRLRSVRQASSGWTDESNIRRSALSFFGGAAYESASEEITDITTIHYGRLTAARLVVGIFNGLAKQLRLTGRAPDADPALAERWRAIGKQAAVERLDERLAELLPGLSGDKPS